jgi:DNA repair protein RadC
MAKSNRRKELENLKGDWTLAELSVTYKTKPNALPVIKSAEALYKFLDGVWDKQVINMQEQFMAIFLNRANRVIGYRLICTGSMNKCLIDIKLLVSLALHSLAEGVVISHNHPSGSLKPSSCDETITFKLKEALALIDVKLMDHIIITDIGYYSFADEGLL